jgi:large subunit ribosomal protein L13
MLLKWRVLNLYNMTKKEIIRKNIEIDATGKAVGRLATEIAIILRGKNKPGFVPHIDSGDFVTVINPDKVKFTGRKLVQKDYYHYTGYPGGIIRTPMKRVFDNNPAEVIRRAVIGMLPKNRLRDGMMKRLTIKV